MALVVIDTDDAASPAELARELGVTRACFSNWAKRHPDFPQPVVLNVYRRSEVIDWHDTRKAEEAARKAARRCCEHDCPCN